MTTTRTIPARHLTIGDTDPDGWVLTRITPTGNDVVMRWARPDSTNTRTWGTHNNDLVTVRTNTVKQTTIITQHNEYLTDDYEPVPNAVVTQARHILPGPEFAIQYLLDHNVTHAVTNSDGEVVGFGLYTTPNFGNRRIKTTFEVDGDGVSDVELAVVRALYPADEYKVA